MRGRWRFVVPNFVTCISLGVALLSIFRSVAGDYEDACWWALLCVLLDKVDGTMARLLKATSEFGVQLDSLSDLIAFGVAPAILVLAALAGQNPIFDPDQVFPHYRVTVYAGAFFYAICAALRLAKFNVLSEAYGKRFFFGIPTTVSGAFFAAYYLTISKYQLSWHFYALLPGFLVLFGLLMVSRIPLSKLVRRPNPLVNAFQGVNVFLVYFCGVFRIFPDYLLFVGTCYLVIGSLVASFSGIKPPNPDVSADLAVTTKDERKEDA